MRTFARKFIEVTAIDSRFAPLPTAMIYPQIIDRYYPEDGPLRQLLIHHSKQVAARALAIADRHPELGADRCLLTEGAMLHDIGIFLTHAPGIHCHGTEPYLLHGRLGAELMRREGREDIARICERHTGTGLTRQNIIDRNLPLPHQDFLPETLEETIVCYADKFYSKSHPERERSLEDTARSLAPFGEQGVRTFWQWAERFE